MMEFLCENHLYLYAICAASCILHVLLNAVYNVYAKDNARLKKSTALLRREGRIPQGFALPLFYKISFELFCTDKRQDAWQSFRFFVREKKNVFFTIPCATLSLIILVACYDVVIWGNDNGTLGGAVALTMFFVFCLLAAREIALRQKLKANKIFSQFVAQLDVYYKNVSLPTSKQSTIDEASEKVKMLCKNTPQNVAERLHEVLPAEKLYAERTVENQRQLNDALNRLFCNIAKKEIG